jgi:hypothetical protein
MFLTSKNRLAEGRFGAMFSYLYLDPGWKPAPPIAPASGQFGFVDLLRYAGAA